MAATSTEPTPAQPLPILGHPLPTLDAVLAEHRRDRTLMAAALHYLGVPEEELASLTASKDWRHMADRIALERRNAWEPIHSESVLQTVFSGCKNLGQREPERHNILMAMRSAGVGTNDIGELLKLEQAMPPIRPTHLNRLLADRIAIALEQAERPVTRDEITKLRSEGEFATLDPESIARRQVPRKTHRIRLPGDQPAAAVARTPASQTSAKQGDEPRRDVALVDCFPGQEREPEGESLNVATHSF